MGDPAGIGPEVIVKALVDTQLRSRARFIIYGLNEQLAYAADLAEVEPFWYRVQHDSGRAMRPFTQDVVVLDFDEYSFLGRRLHEPSKPGGEASLAFVREAISAASHKRNSENDWKLDAIVTGPICKESWALAGERRYPGHTELFKARTHARRSVMMFESPKLRVALATVHEPLMSVGNVLSIGRVFDPIELGHAACLKMGIERPRIAVCGLNPHASENGLFGWEEEHVITPAIRMACEQGIEAAGPFPSDTIFRDAQAGKWDLVVAMYHDQGLIPVKLLAFEEAVNVTLGLPIVRTSVDHGTAFDIAGQNIANSAPMKSAIDLAIRLCGV